MKLMIGAESISMEPGEHQNRQLSEGPSRNKIEKTKEMTENILKKSGPELTYGETKIEKKLTPEEETNGENYQKTCALKKTEKDIYSPEQIRHPQERNSETGGEAGQPNKLPGTQDAAAREETQPTQIESSEGPSLNYRMEKLISLSLVDDAMARLHAQLQGLTPSPQGINSGNFAADDLQIIKQACQTAAEMAKMIKLKIDAAKIVAILSRQGIH